MLCPMGKHQTLLTCFLCLGSFTAILGEETFVLGTIVHWKGSYVSHFLCLINPSPLSGSDFASL